MGPLVVPMSPEFFPETALLLGGVFAGGSALHLLFTRRWIKAARAAAISVACVVLAFVLAGTHSSARRSRDAASRNAPALFAIVPAAGDSAAPPSDPAPSMDLLLGDVLLRVARADRYLLTVDGKEFLELHSLPSGLVADCVAAVPEETSTGAGRAPFPYRKTEMQPSRLDAHTLYVRQAGEDILRVHYAKPGKIEVTGSFFVIRSAKPAVVLFRNGIHWGGGDVSPGTTIDLRREGKGTIDFQRSGLIRIRP
jgi:hypothetical protein